MTSAIILIIVLFLAYSNGANDNFKGVATLFGSGTINYKKALTWGTITTFSGAILSVFLAEKLLKNFSGKGLIPDELLTNPSFAGAVALGAACTVFLATKIGMPISTTHSLTGALAGSGIIAAGSSFNFMMLGEKFFVPLIMSPLLALVIALLSYVVFRFFRKKMKVEKTSCVCAIRENEVALQRTSNEISDSKSKLRIRTGHNNDCDAAYNGKIIGMSAQWLLNTLHYISAGVVSFSRGLNDTPKIAGILLLVGSINGGFTLPSIAIAMALGGILSAKKVAHTMSNKITKMNDGQGFTANLTTAVLVSTASIHGMPVSTTHVSVGSILGIGIANKKGNWKVIREVLLSWVLTLPVAAISAALFYVLLNKIL
ncbi:MAG: PiT family inorganic phosphate transporter [Saprospiraceae bacterium]|jgi:PiT family inorganic phosphate transporter